MKKLLLVVVLTSGCLLAGIVSMAQDNSMDTTINFDTAAVPNDALTSAIRELMTATGAIDIGVTMGKRMIQMQKGTAAALPEVFYERLLADLQNGESSAWILNNAIKAYRKRFTLDEVRTLTTFYKTPVGKKVTALSPEIADETMQEGGKIGKYVALKIYYQLQREGKVN